MGERREERKMQGEREVGREEEPNRHGARKVNGRESHEGKTKRTGACLPAACMRACCPSAPGVNACGTARSFWLSSIREDKAGTRTTCMHAIGQLTRLNRDNDVTPSPPPTPPLHTHTHTHIHNETHTPT